MGRGAQSSIYGSEALNGVIALSLRPNKLEPGFQVSAEVGESGYLKGGFSGGESMGSGSVYGGISFTDEGEPTPGSGFINFRAFFGTEVRLDEDLLMQATALYGSTETLRFPDDSGGFRFADIREQELRNSEALGASFRVVKDWSPHQVEMQVSWFDRQETTDSPGVAPGLRDPVGIVANRFENEFNRLQVQGFGRFFFENEMSLIFGSSWVHETGTSESELFFPGFTLPGSYSIDRDTWSAFSELRKVWNDSWYLALESRFDQISGGEDRWSPRLKAGWEHPDGGARVVLDLADGFKLPSFFALANPLVGNPSLRKEKARSAHMRWEQNWAEDELVTQVSIFHYNIEDLVDFFPGPPPMLMNLSEVNITGYSVEGRYMLNSQFSLMGHWSGWDYDTGNAGDALLNRPDWRGSLILNGQIGSGINLAYEQRWVGSRPDSSIATGAVELSSYSLGQFRVGWQPLETTTFTLTVDNLWDREYDEVVGFPGLSRRIRLRVTQTF